MNGQGAEPGPVSVAIVSRGRPQALLRCLTGVGQLRYPAFEVVVVADPAGISALTGAGWADRIKALAFDQPNISAARNLAIGLAAGSIVAFIDDDAVPEPTWLSHLCGPFSDPQVTAAGGYVRGRNGITFQWPPAMVDDDGRTVPLTLDGMAPRLIAGRPGAAIKTEGTNMAFRRDALVASGGFDPVFRFYLDETDLNLRLAAQGAVTALVPQAQVHHGFAASAQRRADRVPRDLFEVGASIAAFARKHGRNGGALIRAEAETRRRALLAHMVAGRIEPRDVDRILRSLEQGALEGCRRTPTTPLPLTGPDRPFRAYVPPVAPRGHRVLSGRPGDALALRSQAAKLVADGWLVSVYVFSTGIAPHQVQYHAEGFWEQRGGLFGRSDRAEPGLVWQTRTVRLRKELKRVAGERTSRDNASEDEAVGFDGLG